MLITACILFFNIFKVDGKMEPFIVGGTFVKIEDYPHAAFLAIACDKNNYGKKNTEHFSCGSSVLNQRILLTAAHCLEECLPSSTVLVAAGVIKRKGPFTHEVGHFVVHPQYDSDKVANDVALVGLTSNLPLGKKIKRVVLMKNPPYKEISAVAGWGVTNEETGAAAMYLKAAKQMYVNRKKCQKVLKMLNKGTFCLTGVNQMPDFGYAAAGDSGSGILVRGYIQIGLVSYKIPQYSASIIGATDVGYFFPWIRANARELYCQLDNTK